MTFEIFESCSEKGNMLLYSASSVNARDVNVRLEGMLDVVAREAIYICGAPSFDLDSPPVMSC